MIDIPVVYETSVFGNMDTIATKPDNISKLLTSFQDKELLPSTFVEFSPALEAPTQRIRLASSNDGWLIDFPKRRIVIAKTLIQGEDGGKNMGSIEAFSQDASEFLSRINNIFPKKYTRLSLVTRGFLREMTDKQLKSTYMKIFNLPSSLEEGFLTEWKTTFVKIKSIDINEISEDVNVMISLSYSKNAKMIRPNLPNFELNEPTEISNRIEISFDINTHQNNADPRFDVKSLDVFYANAIEIISDLLLELEAAYF